MVYLINICSKHENVISAKCSTQECANELIKSFKESGIDIYRVGFLCYWLQKHSFYGLAAVLAPLSNPE